MEGAGQDPRSREERQPWRGELHQNKLQQRETQGGVRNTTAGLGSRQLQATSALGSEETRPPQSLLGVHQDQP